MLEERKEVTFREDDVVVDYMAVSHSRSNRSPLSQLKVIR
jgi:hypothetical protein